MIRKLNLNTDQNRHLAWVKGKEEWLLAIPFLLLYGMICVALATDTFVSDEGRYFRFANNLLQGYYSPPPPEVSFWNGPGYPLFLAFFLLFGSPLLLLKLLNALLLAASIVLYYRTVKSISNRNTVLLFTLALALYYPIYRYLPNLLTECLTWFLFAWIGYLFLRNFWEAAFAWGKVIPTGFAIAFLTLTKVIFGYAVLGLIVVSGVALLLPAWRVAARKSLAIFSLAMLFCLPWLAYTYSLSGKLFYWSDAGGMSLYTMSSPYVEETGDWFSKDQLLAMPNHQAFMEELLKLTPMEQDEAFKEQAKQNIKEHPGKFAKNVVYNLGRLLFFPSTHAPNTLMSYYAFPINILMVSLILISLGIAAIQFRKLPPELVFLLLFVLMYLGGSTLVSAYRRMFFITMPFWFLFIQYVFTHLISIRLTGKPDEKVRSPEPILYPENV